VKSRAQPEAPAWSSPSTASKGRNKPRRDLTCQPDRAAAIAPLPTWLSSAVTSTMWSHAWRHPLRRPPATPVAFALLQPDGEKRLHPCACWARLSCKAKTVVAGAQVPIETGNALPLSAFPWVRAFHNVELYAAGVADGSHRSGSARWMRQREVITSPFKLPSTEVRWCVASATPPSGKVGNAEIRNTSLGKADAALASAAVPRCAAVLMNPCDHPHGGWRGPRSDRPLCPVSPWRQACPRPQNPKRNKPSKPFGCGKGRRNLQAESRGATDT